jgi:TM2 domain-containing membrane protein YozV
MEQSKIDMFIGMNGKKFPMYYLDEIRKTLTRLDDNKFSMVVGAEYKDPTMMLIVSLVGGYFGIDRFLVGDIGLGVIKLLTCGGFGIWTIIDWFLIMDRTRDYNLGLFADITNIPGSTPTQPVQQDTIPSPKSYGNSDSINDSNSNNSSSSRI